MTAIPKRESAVPTAPLELHCLYDDTVHAKHGDLVVDIIAIHGLGANPDYAWYCKPDAANPNGVSWLKDQDLLPSTLKNHSPRIFARTFCFNYTSAWFGSKLTKNRLEDLGRKLLDCIEHSILQRAGKAGSAKRPLLFICHSFGGIVLEQAVVQAASTSSPLGSGLLEVICGIIFLGTPHAGSDMTRFGLMVANAAHVLDLGQSELLADVDLGSWKVWDMVASFIQTINKIGLSNDKEVVCFFENKPTDYTSRLPVLGRSLPNLFGGMVVTRESAVLQGFHGVLLESDHLKLNKYRASSDPGYKSITTNMIRIICNSPTLIKGRCIDTNKSLSSHFLVPSVGVKNFIGRDTELEQITSHFATPRIHGPLILVLHAMGGQGKSQLALEYCRSSRQKRVYRAIFWIQAHDEGLTTRSFHDVAVELGLKTPGDLLEPRLLLSLVKQALEVYEGRWLLVFDNYDQPQQFKNIKDYFPEATNGDILITSRLHGLDRLGTPMELHSLGVDECIGMLLRCYTPTETQAYLDEAKKIVERLGCLPLAVDQAASYLAFRQDPITKLGEFLGRYEAQREKVLKHLPHESWEYSTIDQTNGSTALSAITTWEMSLQQLQWKCGNDTDSVIHLLSLCAFLAPTTIGEFMFRWYWEGRFWWIDRWGSDHNRAGWLHTGKETSVTEQTLRWWRAFHPNHFVQSLIEEEHDKKQDSWLRRTLAGIYRYLIAPIFLQTTHTDQASSYTQYSTALTWDTDHFWNTVSILDGLSLIRDLKRQEDGEARFSLHPVIRDWLQLRLTAKESCEFKKEATTLIASCADMFKATGSPYRRMRLLTAHIDECLAQDQRLTVLGNADLEGLEYDIIIHRLSRFYHEQRRVESARVILQVALDPIRLSRRAQIESQLQWHGVSYSAVARSVQDMLIFELHSLYESSGMMFEARELLLARGEFYNQLATQPGMPITWSMLMCQSLALQEKGQTKPAIDLANQASKMIRQACGDSGPWSKVDMAASFSSTVRQEDIEQVAIILQRALHTEESQDRSAVDKTASEIVNLALQLSSGKRHEESEQLLRQALTHYDTPERAKHPVVLALIRMLALEMFHQEKFERSYAMYLTLLARQEPLYGPNHIDVLRTNYWLGSTLGCQHEFVQAKMYLEHAANLQAKTLGHEHLETLVTKHQLALVLYGMKQYAQSEVLCRDLLRAQGTHGELDFIDTAGCIARLQRAIVFQGNELYEAGDYLKAREAWQRGLNVAREHKEDDLELICMNMIACCSILSGLDAEAEPICRALLERRKSDPTSDHEEIISLSHLLGNSLSGQGKFDDAVSVFSEIEQQQQESMPGTNSLMYTRLEYARCLYLGARYPEAESMVRTVLKMDNSAFVKDDSQNQEQDAAILLMTLMLQKISAVMSEKTYTVAETRCREAIDIARSHGIEEHVISKLVKVMLANCLIEQDQLVEPELILSTTLDTSLVDPDGNHAVIISTMITLGLLHTKQKAWGAAKDVLVKALSSLSNCKDENATGLTVQAKFLLGKTYNELRSRQDAESLFYQVLEYEDDVLTRADIDRDGVVGLLSSSQSYRSG